MGRWIRGFEKIKHEGSRDRPPARRGPRRLWVVCPKGEGLNDSVAALGRSSGSPICHCGWVIWLVEPAQTWVLTLAGRRAAGETTIGETCQDEALGAGPLPVALVPADAERVEVGQSLQQTLDRIGEGGVAVLSSGVHTGQSARPLHGQEIIGEPGAVLRGEGSPFAFRSGATGVVIQGLVIEGYEPEEKAGVIQGEQGARSWTIYGNEIHHNGEVGIVAKSGWDISENRIHHNGRYGVNGSGSQVRLVANEIACNALDYGSTSDSAATKFVHTSDLLMSRNNVHHNFGNGLWVDINNVDFRIEGNRTDGNAYSGIFVEISCGGVVRDNDVLRNGFGSTRPAGMENAGILVTNSPGVEVLDNRLADNAKGIGAVQWAHGNRVAGDRCVPELRDLRVQDNEITQEAGLVAGIDATIDRGSVWTAWGNTFLDNIYVLGSEARFRWEGSTIGHAEWANLGLG